MNVFWYMNVLVIWNLLSSSIFFCVEQLSIIGLSGEIKFDYQGLRTDFELEVVELTPSGLQKIGSWTPSKGYATNRPAQPIVSDLDMRSLVNRSFVVITALVLTFSEKFRINNIFEYSSF